MFQADQALAEVQVKLSQLIYRYLAAKSDLNYTKGVHTSEDYKAIENTSRKNEASSCSSIMPMSDHVEHLNPDEKTRLLISLVDDLHDCVDIIHNRSLLVQADMER